METNVTIPFNNIITKEGVKDGESVDIIGRVHHFDPIKPGQNCRVNFQLMDLSGNVVSCTLWRAFATDFDAYMKKTGSEKPVIIVIQFGRTALWDGKLTVSSDWTFTKLVLNTDDAAITEFRSSLADYHGEEITSGSLAPTLTPTTNEWFNGCRHVKLSDLSPTESGMFVVHAEILSILSSPNWYYIACKKCNKKPIPKDRVEDLTMDIDTQLSRAYDCSTPKCKAEDIKVAVRFKVPVRVHNKTGNVSLTLFETDVEKYITTSAYQLLKEMPEDQDIPDELDELIGVKMLFKINIRSYNNTSNSTNYTVTSTKNDPETVKLYWQEYGLCQDDDWEVVDADMDGCSSHVGSSNKFHSSSNNDSIATIDMSASLGDSPPRKRIKLEMVDTPLSVKSSSTKTNKTILP